MTRENLKREELYQDRESLNLWLNKDGSIIYSEQDDSEFLAHIKKDYVFNTILYYQDL